MYDVICNRYYLASVSHRGVPSKGTTTNLPIPTYLYGSSGGSASVCRCRCSRVPSLIITLDYVLSTFLHIVRRIEKLNVLCVMMKLFFNIVYVISKTETFLCRSI